MKVFFHDDVDGLTAAVLVELHFPEKTCKLIPYDYTIPFPTELVNRNEEVWILDISFSESTKNELHDLMHRTSKITWIDHHISSIELEIRSSLIYKASGLRDTRYSSAALCWMYLNSLKDFSKLPLFIRMISDSDTARHEIPEAFEFMLGLELKMRSDYSEIIQQLIKESNQKCERNRSICPFLVGLSPLLDRLIEDGKAILGYKMRLSESYEQNYLNKGKIDGHEAYILNCLAEIPMISMKNLGNNSEMFVGFMYDGRKNQYIYRLYSDNPEIDCREIAEKYGGGGHRCAAGFRHTRNLIEWDDKEGGRTDVQKDEEKA